MGMKRRQFLKSVFGVAVGAVVAPSVVKAKFNTEDFGGWNPKDGWTANQEYPLGTTFETGSGLSHRTYRYCKCIDPTKEFFKVMAKELPPLVQKRTDDFLISSLI